ncbi:hypothetical protein VTN31DRAFT_2647 [Thermomyces dupontii]|uniref:uncharacterized protein n=1 Tax=Talaromyces thermophilus TaxID=28565 RepID=UPI0037421B56
MLALWLGLTACLALARAGPPPDPDDPYVLQLPSSLIDDAAREKILKPCNDPLVQTIDQDPVAVWEGLGCYELHGVLDYDWYINQNNTKYSYVEYLSDRMHGDGLARNLLIPIITLGLGVMGTVAEKTAKTVAAAIDSAKTSADKAKKYEDKIKEGIVLSAGMAMPYGLIHLPAELTGETTNAKVFSLLGQVYDQLSRMQMKQVNDLYNGSSASMSTLHKIIDGGTFTWFDGNRTLFDYHEEIKKMFFAALIPKVWEVAPGYEDKPDERKWHATPMFLKTGQKCGEKAPSFERNALGAYERSGQQLWSPPEGASIVKKDGSSYALQFTEGLHTPGLVQMQVCDDIGKMQDVLEKQKHNADS